MNQDSAALLRAIKGPVMMITVGVLFALDNFTPMSFGRTWPLLLVVAGILNLGKTGTMFQGTGCRHGRSRSPRPPYPPPPPPPPAPPSMTVDPTTGPGSYRGSNYESAPGATSAPRGSENKERRESPVAGSNPTAPPGMGGTQ